MCRFRLRRPNVKGMLFKHAPIPVLRFGQRVMLRYPAPMRMHAVPEAEMVAALEAAGMDCSSTECPTKATAGTGPTTATSP